MVCMSSIIPTNMEEKQWFILQLDIFFRNGLKHHKSAWNVLTLLGTIAFAHNLESTWKSCKHLWNWLKNATQNKLLKTILKNVQKKRQLLVLMLAVWSSDACMWKREQESSAFSLKHLNIFTLHEVLFSSLCDFLSCSLLYQMEHFSRILVMFSNMELSYGNFELRLKCVLVLDQNAFRSNKIRSLWFNVGLKLDIKPRGKD